MKKKKLISMVLAAGMMISNAVTPAVTTFAATSPKAKVESKLTQREIREEAYNLLKEIRKNPTEENIKQARKVCMDFNHPLLRQAYLRSVDREVEKNIEKGISPVDELANAYKATQDITSAQVQGNFTMNIDGENLSEEEKSILAEMIPFINTLRVGINAKTKGSDNNKKAKLSGNVLVNVAGMKLDIKTWTDVDITSKTPKMKSIVQIPEEAKAFLPEKYKDKKYFVYDLDAILSKVSKENEQQLPDFGKIMNAGTKLGEKLNKNLGTFLKVCDAKYNIISRKDLSKLDKDVAKDLAKAYEINIDNNKFAEIVKDALSNKEIVKAFKEYINELSKMDPDMKGEKIEDEEIDKVLQEAIKGIDKIKDVVKFNLVSEVGVDKQGFICHENVTFKLSFKPKDIAKLFGGEIDKDMNSNAIYTISFNVDSSLKDINNKDLEIDPMPQVNKDNSIDFVDMMEDMSSNIESIENK